MIERCPWCGTAPLYVKYHDEEWGVPEYDSLALFEKLLLDGAQAGLSWWTILSKRENYRRAFAEFDPSNIASYTNDHLELLMQDSGIVRNRLKIQAFRTNARVYLNMLDNGTDLSKMLWGYIDGRPIVNHLQSMNDVVPTTPLSDRISKDLKKLGFKFVGSTIVYAFMQAVGMVNDHLVTCPRHAEVQKLYQK